jgi:hypothetical protein
MVSSQRDPQTFKGTPLAKEQLSRGLPTFSMDSAQMDRQMNPVYTPSLVQDHPCNSRAQNSHNFPPDGRTNINDRDLYIYSKEPALIIIK